VIKSSGAGSPSSARTPWRRSLGSIVGKARIGCVFRSYLAFRCPPDDVNISCENLISSSATRLFPAIRYVSSSRFRRVQFYTDSDRARRRLVPMASDISIIRVEKDGPDGIIVTFSDGTFGANVVEELLELRPHRETVQVESRPTAIGKAQLSRRRPESTMASSLR
jgi:hypothetical protein